MATAQVRVVGDVMVRDVVTVKPQEPLSGVYEGMLHYHIRHLPVVSRRNVLVGMVSLRDLLRAMSSCLLPGAEDRSERIFRRFCVEDVMCRDLTRASVDTPIEEAAHLLWDTKCECLPVVDDEDHLIGVMTEADFLKLTVQLLALPAEDDPPFDNWRPSGPPPPMT